MASAAFPRETIAPPARHLTRRDLRRLALAGAALAIAAGGAWFGNDWSTRARFIESTDDAYVGGNVTPVAPHVGGFVQQVMVADNQRVSAGQPLIRLDARDYQAASDHAAAVVAARLAALESLRAQYVLQQSTIRQQQADLTAKSARARFAAIDAVRYSDLARSAAGSRQEAERTEALDSEARAAVIAATANLEAARQKLKVLEAQIAEAEAATAQARSDLETAQLNLGYTEIRSPIDGYVGNRAAQAGAYVTQGTYLVSIVPAHGLWVDANFKEDQLGHITAGQPASVVADVLPGHEFRGHVASLAPGTGAVFSIIPPENATGNFTKIVQRVPVRILLDDSDSMLRMLRPGLSTTVGIDKRTTSRKAP